jgi:ABC-type transport system involved in multi-copper enzyme maturation permease subunit
MRDLLSTEWLRLRRYWLPRSLMILLVGIVGLQLKGRVNELETLRIEAETGLSEFSGEPLRPEQIEGGQMRIKLLEDMLRYPAVIGTAVELSTGAGWYFLILLTAVMGGEDFSRRTLSPILALGVGRGSYLLARILAFWTTMGAALLLVMLLAAVAGPWFDAQVGGPQGITTTSTLELAAQTALVGLRTWMASLPYIVVTLFWVVLGQQAGPAMGVGMGLRTFELLGSLFVPVFSLLANGEGILRIFPLTIRVFTTTVGYNAEILMRWGEQVTLIEGAEIAAEMNSAFLLPTDPWRAMAILAIYLVVFSSLSFWILSRRDVGHAS